MNWKIIIGGILIFAGIAQLIKLFSEYRYTNSLPMLTGMGIVFTALLITGIYLVNTGRKSN